MLVKFVRQISLDEIFFLTEELRFACETILKNVILIIEANNEKK